MRRRSAVAAEFGHARHDGLAKMAHPDVGHSHAGRERVGAIDEPAGEGETTTAAAWWIIRDRTLRIVCPRLLFRAGFGAKERFLRLRDFLRGFWFTRTYPLACYQEIAACFQHRLLALGSGCARSGRLPLFRILFAFVFQSLRSDC